MSGGRHVEFCPKMMGGPKSELRWSNGQWSSSTRVKFCDGVNQKWWFQSSENVVTPCKSSIDSSHQVTVSWLIQIISVRSFGTTAATGIRQWRRQL